MTNFILGGYEEYARSLRENYEARVQALRQQLAMATSPVEVLRLERELRQEREDYERRLLRADDCEF